MGQDLIQAGLEKEAEKLAKLADVSPTLPASEREKILAGAATAGHGRHDAPHPLQLKL